MTTTFGLAAMAADEGDLNEVECGDGFRTGVW